VKLRHNWFRDRRHKSRQIIPTNVTLKLKEWFQRGAIFWPRQTIYWYLWKIYKIVKWQTNGSWRSHYALHCRPVKWITISTVQQYRWRCTSAWRWLEEIKYQSLSRQRPLLPLCNLLSASKHPHNSPFSCCCSLLVPVSVFRHPDDSFSQSKPLGQPQTLMSSP
jgi:hypothetical protein